MLRYWYTTCPLCDQGRLFVLLRYDRDGMVLSCEECYTTWDAPDHVGKNDKGYSGIDIRADTASLEDILARGYVDAESLHEDCFAPELRIVIDADAVVRIQISEEWESGLVGLLNSLTPKRSRVVCPTNLGSLIFDLGAELAIDAHDPANLVVRLREEDRDAVAAALRKRADYETDLHLDISLKERGATFAPDTMRDVVFETLSGA